MATNNINLSEGSQYFIQDGHGFNRMVSPDKLISTLERHVNQNNIKKIEVTMYIKIEKEVKIIGDTRYFEYLTRNEPGAKFVIEKHDVIFAQFRFNADASALIGTKGQILLQKNPVDDMTDKLKSLSLNNEKEIDDITDTLKSMTLNDEKTIIKKNHKIVVV